ncbi:hypothetical protein DCAR_0208144 [Daucus carota subsp. sativus]|uniref:Uncharacterized protein n=1 Tax=Daucus carota subsp. sativus TaxID=79200 RepID=A0A166ECI1_DAUCS|nr:PREDICTED: protein ODORANT1-like [Daucus carota subsp. sativus]WOG88909.1 hypothetical protein DCAR_0208144 [Daucus carota subsp. sativus]
MGRRACCEKIGLKKGPWTADEDQKLRDFIHANDTKYCWRAVPKLAGLLRCGKSCRLRWANYLRPDLKTDTLSKKEEKLVIHLRSQFGNKWSQIASHLPGRTDNYIKNYWHNHIKKRLNQIDSKAHKPRFPDQPATTSTHYNTCQKRAEKRREDMDAVCEDDMAKENLTIDSGFSVDEIPLIEDHEIINPHSLHLPSNDCSTSSIPYPCTALTATKVENVKSSAYWQGNDECNNYDGNMGVYYSCEDDFTDWDWLLNDFDIDEEID